MDKIQLFAPGRLCLFGEHSDWAGGYRKINSKLSPGCAIVTGLEQGIYATAYRSKEFCVKSYIPGHEEEYSCVMDFRKLREKAREGEYFSYVAGVASYIDEWYRVDGITLEITKQTLPMKSGLSSSAAVCVLVARAFNELYDLQLNTLGIMNIAYLGEQRTPSRCGRLDQACAFGVRPVRMTFDGDEIQVDRMVVGAPLYYVLADLKASKDTIRILADLNSGFPFARTHEDEQIQEALGEDNLDIIQRAQQLMAEGDAKSLGALMVEAQDLFDKKVAPKSPQELAAPVLHSVLSDERVIALTYGRKGVGSQGDGTVQLLARSEDAQNDLIHYLETERKMTCYKLTLQPGSLVKKAVIPVAGFGTRLYPETRGVKKEFCPVPDTDGFLKPAILILLEELDEVGIENICLVIQREEKQSYRDFFFKPLPAEHFKKLPRKMQQYEERIRAISGKLSFVYQDEMLGFGHAVYQAANFSGGEPVLMLLGDTIYKSYTSEKCTAQLMHQYDVVRKSMVAVHSVPLDDVHNYGVFAGNWENSERTVMEVHRIKEKPTREYAADYLGMEPSGRSAVRQPESGQEYYAAFGAYIVGPEIFAELHKMVMDSRHPELNAEENTKTEIEFTEALVRTLNRTGLMAYVPDGESYDIGNVEAYKKTVAEFSR